MIKKSVSRHSMEAAHSFTVIQSTGVRASLPDNSISFAALAHDRNWPVADARVAGTRVRN
jgi:hypothetical protein